MAKCSTPKQQTDTDIIFSLLEQAREKANEVRERSAAIKSVPCGGKIAGGVKDECAAIDVSDRIRGGIQSILNSLDDALESLRAFN